jgi:four helix bundle protein
LAGSVVVTFGGPKPSTSDQAIMNNEKADEIEDRLIDFGVQIIHLSGRLPANHAGEHIAKQMLRSGTSPAPNYGEARGAESRADFVHKLGIALKELNETKVWLKMLARARLASADTVGPVLDECQQLARILNASIQTARRSAR